MRGLELVALIERAQRLEDVEAAVMAVARSMAPTPGGLVEFFEVVSGDAFDVAPEKAIDYFKGKGLAPTFSYADMLGDAHDHAFTVAKMLDVDMLSQVRASLDSALANGTPFKEWAKDLMPMLQKAGWWGQKEVLDPLTGAPVVAQLGSPWRLETIFRTNMQNAYAAAAWQEIKANEEVAPFLMYDAVDDFRTRPLHKLWDNTVLPVGSPWWHTHYPPNGWNCRCGVIQLSQDEVEGLGLQVAPKPPDNGSYEWTNPRTGEVLTIPNGIDPGFWKNSGESYQLTLDLALKEKVAALPPDMKPAAKAAERQAAKLAADAEAAAKQAQIELAKAQGAAALERAKAIAAEKAKQFDAQAKLDAISKGKDIPGAGAQFKVKALQQLQKDSDWLEAKATTKLDMLQELAAQLKAKQKLSSDLSLYKKAILEGKTPAPGPAKGFASLPYDEKAAFLAKIDKEKAALDAKKAAEAAAAAPVEQKLVTGQAPDPANLTKIGEQKGSNPGGTYQDTTTGLKWYIKQPASADIARNEVLAGKLYELAGVDVPELHLITLDGKTSIASRIVDGLAKGDPSTLAGAAGTADGFAVDAWLANWDVVGLGYDNLLMKGSRAFRVDTGGALRYRAQGGLKGQAFGDKVTEFDSLRDPSLNRQAQSVFGRLTDQQIEDSAVRVLKTSDDEIRRVVKAYGPEDAAENKALADRLIARKADVAKRYPEAAKRAAKELGQVEATPSAGARVTAAEQAEVEASRSNGYGFATDSDQIEDHMVVVHTYREKGGADTTRGFFKLREEASQALRNSISASDGDAQTVNLSEARQNILDAVKSINFRADKGQPLDAKVVQRIENAQKTVKKALADLNKASSTAKDLDGLLEAHEILEAWLKKLEAVLPAAKAGQAALKFGEVFPVGKLPDSLAYELKVAGEKPAGLPWRKVTGTYQFETARFERSFATMNGVRAPVTGVSVRYEATLPDGTRITYFPHESANAWSMQGVVKIDVPGKGVNSTERVFSAMSEAGITAKRATELDRQHLYANAFARLALLRGEPAKFRAAFDAITGKDQAALDEKLAILKKATGVDVAASEGWKTVDGVREGFGHGRAYQYRPDLSGAELEAMGREYVVYHNPVGLGHDAGSGAFERLKTIIESGGIFSSVTDRVRRGVPLSGTSIASDLESGGGEYHFTRIRKRAGQLGTGVYWKASTLRRMDAISYESDMFGRTTGTTIDTYRHGQSIESLKRMANYSSNETIFKSGLSVFEQLDRIVLSSQAEVDSAIAWMKSHGYKAWPDGRALDEVIITKAKHARKP